MTNQRANYNKFSNKNKKGERALRRLTKNIVEKTYDGSAMTFVVLATLGKACTKMFLKPTYYIDDSSEIFWKLEEFKRCHMEKKAICQTLTRLKSYGLVKQQNEEFSLTQKGKKIINKILGYKEALGEKWDGKYRVVIFDIPEKDRHHRNWLRSELYFLKYTKLQQSVFISKFSLTEDIIKEIKKRGIDKGVNYLLVEHVYDLEGEKLGIKI